MSSTTVSRSWKRVCSIARYVVQQGRDRVQGVEQEVGLELGLQELQPGLGEPDLELGGGELALAHDVVVVERVADPDDPQVVIDAEAERGRGQAHELLPQGRTALPHDRVEEELVHEEEAADVDGEDDQQGERVRQQRPRPALLRDGPAVRHPEDEGCEGRPGQDAEEAQQDVAPADGLAPQVEVEDPLPGEKECDDQPHAEDDSPAGELAGRGRRTQGGVVGVMQTVAG
jgi:hypothetical protein